MLFFLKKTKFILLFILTCSILALSAQTSARPFAAYAKKVVSKVIVHRGNQQIKLKKGLKLYQGDRLETGKKGWVMIIFRDKTKFVLGRNAAFKINHYHYTKRKKDNMFVSILRGPFRFISGIMAKKRHQSMQVKVGRRLATIGIRGTHVAGEVIGDSSDIMLLEPEEEEEEIIAEATEELLEEVKLSEAKPVKPKTSAPVAYIKPEPKISPKTSPPPVVYIKPEPKISPRTSPPPVTYIKPKSNITRISPSIIPIQPEPVIIEKITRQEAEKTISEMKAPSSIKVENDFGSVIIDKPGYGTNIPDAYSPPSPPRRMKLRTISNLMRSMQRARRMHRF